MGRQSNMPLKENGAASFDSKKNANTFYEDFVLTECRSNIS